MRPRFAYLVCALLLLCAAAGCGDTVRNESQPSRRTAAEIYSDMENERLANRPNAALKLAQDLIVVHPGTPEADKAANQIQQLESAVKAAKEAERARAAEAAAAAEAQSLANKWTYRINEDPMTSRKARYATIESENTVTFGFPYQGRQRASLTIRDHPTYGSDVIFSIERGQILCHSHTDCEVGIRFDECTSERWSAAGPSDDSTTYILLLSGIPRFVQKLRAAKIVRIQARIYQEGEPVFEFQVGGFDYARYQSGD